MKEILTNEEIDSLFELFKSEGAPAEEELLSPQEGPGGGGLRWDVPAAAAPTPPPRQKMVHRFDLFRPNRFTREQIQYLEKIQEISALGITSTLTERLRLEGNCDCVLVDQQRFGTFLAGLHAPIAVYTIKLAALDQRALLTVSCPLLFAAIDRIMGGAGKTCDADRDLTDVEYSVVENLVTSILGDITTGFRELVTLDAKVEGRPRNLALAQVVGSQEVVLVLHFQVSGEKVAGDIQFVIPHAALASFLDRFDQAGGGQKFEDPSYRKSITDRLCPAGVDVAVELGRADLRLGELLRMNRGDLLVLNETRVGDPVKLCVEGIPKFTTTLGLRGKRYAVRVDRPVKPTGSQ